jgi:hypothetical protein
MWTCLPVARWVLPLLPSRHVLAAVVGRVVRSRRVGAGFRGRGQHRHSGAATTNLYPPQSTQQQQHHNHHHHHSTQTNPQPPHKNNPSSPEPRLGFQQTDTHSHTHFYGPLPSHHARARTFNPSLQSFSGLCYLHTEKNRWRRKGLALTVAAPRAPLASRQPCLRFAAAGGGELPAIYRAIDKTACCCCCSTRRNAMRLCEVYVARRCRLFNKNRIFSFLLLPSLAETRPLFQQDRAQLLRTEKLSNDPCTYIRRRFFFFRNLDPWTCKGWSECSSITVP